MAKAEQALLVCLLLLLSTQLKQLRAAPCESAGKFGEDCQHQCNCQAPCNTTTGICPTSCNASFEGPTCQKNNVAFRKNAIASSTWNDEWTADKAVDGDTRQDVNKDSCFHSRSREPYEWSVDLGAVSPTDNIVVYYRTGYLQRFNNTQILVANASGSAVLCTTVRTTTPDGNAVFRFNCSSFGSKLIFRHVSPCGECVLELCEVQVFECTAGFEGENCTKGCRGGWYGRSCLSPCGHCALDKECRSTDGVCLQGCCPGWQGDRCMQVCSNGTYGQNCSLQCGQCLDGDPCDHETGLCPNGLCQPGYRGDRCDETCTEGHYGSNCSEACGQCRDSRPCLHVNGTCPQGCVTGWGGDECHDCDAGWYGRDCTPCGNCFNDTACDVINGSCPRGLCEPGYSGVTCFQECQAGTYGQNCSQACSTCADGSACHYVFGNCSVILISDRRSGGDSSPALGAGLGVGIIALVAIVIVIVFLVRRKGGRTGRKSQDNGRTPIAKEEKKVDQCIFIACEGDGYMNPGLSRRLSSHSVRTEDSLSTASLDTLDSKEDLADAKVKDDDTYYNMAAVPGHVDLASPSSIATSDLEKVVASKNAAGAFEAEYESVSNKFLASYKVAQGKEHTGKNKFKSYYPYDFNRVVLEPTATDPNSHYINASFIDGFERRKTFIASQAPLPGTMPDFLRMIWQQRCTHVIMLTNLVEENRVKSERYWPEAEGEELRSGEVTVTLKQKTEWSYCTLRLLTLTHEKGGSMSVKQFHFTTWPDHGVPSHVDMLDFFWKVRASWTPDSGPMLVHCSAGVGRTGTFIALCILSDQAASQHRVDPLATLTALRHQRRNMIQTLVQYTFLHEALVRVVKQGRTAVDKEDFCSRFPSKKGGMLVGNRTLDQLAQDLVKMTAEMKNYTREEDHVYSNAANAWNYLENSSMCPSTAVKRGLERVKLWGNGSDVMAPTGLWTFLKELGACVLIDLHGNQGPCVAASSKDVEGKDSTLAVDWKPSSQLAPGVSSRRVHLSGQGVGDQDVEYVALDLSAAKLPGSVATAASRLASAQLSTSRPVVLLYRPSEESCVQLLCAAVNVAQGLSLDGHVELASSLLRLQTPLDLEVVGKLADVACAILQDDLCVYANS